MGSGQIHGQLGTIGVLVPVSFPGKTGDAAGVRETVPLHRQGSSHCSTLGGKTMVHSVGKVLVSSRVEFLSLVWSQHTSADMVTSLLQGLYILSMRQYELAWKKFQGFL